MADLLHYIGFKPNRGKFSRSTDLLPVTCYLFIFCLLTAVAVQGQEMAVADTQAELIPANLAPPPVKFLTKEEKSALDGTRDVKDRTRMALDLMEVRLKKAEELNTQESFGALLSELGGFHALMDDAIKFLNRTADGRGKVLNNFKRFEMALRAFTPRLELLRREMPDSYEYHIRRLLVTVRDMRAKAVEPLFGNTILPAGN